ncbi:MAG: hypothetical protein H7Y42_04545 [Chitinophagaceae bacterium]|nr:hypothetical protein [Chitinophagaceae bacterium]
MRRFYLILLPILFLVENSHSQSAVQKVASLYFRSDPFVTSFSSFMKHLLNDPTLTDKIIKKRTDSTLFYFQGTYSSHNPFFFKPKRTEVVLKELPAKLDSSTVDTIYTYQLFAFIDETKEGTAELKKQFEKICKKYKSNFSKTTFNENKESKLENATYNFFERSYAIAPLAVTWVGPNSKNEMCLILTIRMETQRNMARLPVPLYTF